MLAEMLISGLGLDSISQKVQCEDVLIPSSVAHQRRRSITMLIVLGTDSICSLASRRMDWKRSNRGVVWFEIHGILRGDIQD